jgi:hypothetical protein
VLISKVENDANHESLLIPIYAVCLAFSPVEHPFVQVTCFDVCLAFSPFEHPFVQVTCYVFFVAVSLIQDSPVTYCQKRNYFFLLEVIKIFQYDQVIFNCSNKSSTYCILRFQK